MVGHTFFGFLMFTSDAAHANLVLVSVLIQVLSGQALV